MDDYRKLLPIDDTKLDSELAKQAATFMFVAEESAKAAGRLATFKVEADEKIAGISSRVRQALDMSGAKVTEKLVEQSMDSDPDYVTIKKTLATLAYQADLAKALERAWYMRKDMLVQIAIGKRAEMELCSVNAA